MSGIDLRPVELATLENIGKTDFHVSVDFDELDDGIKEFIVRRNELATLAEDIGLCIKQSMLVLTKKDPSAATDGPGG